MLEFLVVFAVSVGSLLAVQAVDVECAQPQQRRRLTRITLPRRRPLSAMLRDAIPQGR